MIDGNSIGGMTVTPAPPARYDLPAGVNARRVVNVRAWGATAHGIGDDGAAFALAGAEAAGVGAALYVPPGTYRLAADVVLPDGVRLVLDAGARVAPDAGAALYVPGGVDAPASQVFGTDGAVHIAGDVRPEWWGAVPDLVAHGTLAQCQANTLAFRKACKGLDAEWLAAAAWGRIFRVCVGAGTWYLANGTGVPSGVGIFGAGSGATSFQQYDAQADPVEPALPLFALGQTLVGEGATLALSGSAGIQLFGAAPQIWDAHFLSQHASRPALYAKFPGVQFGRLFFTSCGRSLELDGAGDVVGSDIIFDQGLTHVYMHGGTHNVALANVLHFTGNYHYLLDTGCKDVQVEGYHGEYAGVANIYLNDGATGITNVQFNGAQILMNAQYSTFVGCVRVRSTGCDLQLNHPTFRNWKGYAVKWETGIGNRVRLVAPVFDGDKTQDDYTQSTTAAGINVGAMAVELINPTFRNLRDVPVTMGGSGYTGSLRWQGGRIEGGTYAGPSINITNTTGGLLTLDNVDGGGRLLYNAQSAVTVQGSGLRRWLDPVATASGRDYVLIPCSQGASFRLSLVANPLPAGSANYRKSAMYYLGKHNGHDGVAFRSYLTLTKLAADPATGAVPELSVQADFDAVGGGVIVPSVNSGYVAVSVPEAYNSIRIEVEPLL